MKMVFIYTREYDSEKMEYSERKSYSLGLAKADGSMKDVATGMILTAENYCEMCLENDPNSCPVVANVQNVPQTEEEWKILTDEINRRYLDTARIKEFLNSLIPPFKEPYNYEG